MESHYLMISALPLQEKTKLCSDLFPKLLQLRFAFDLSSGLYSTKHDRISPAFLRELCQEKKDAKPIAMREHLPESHTAQRQIPASWRRISLSKPSEARVLLGGSAMNAPTRRLLCEFFFSNDDHLGSHETPTNSSSRMIFRRFMEIFKCDSFYFQLKTNYWGFH